MHCGNVKYCDIANGTGVRTSVFVSGCTHCCAGCFQPETWDFSYGSPFDEAMEEEILESLAPAYIDGLTVLGGEPMEPANQPAVLGLLQKVRERFPQKSIWLFTGDVYEDLLKPENPRRTLATEGIFDCVDVLVDGPFIQERAQAGLRFRGSSNQRLIDMNRTRATGVVTEWQDDRAFAARGQW